MVVRRSSQRTTGRPTVRQADGLLQQRLHGLGLLGPGAPGSVHVDGVAQHDALRPVLSGQGGNPLRHGLRAVGVDDGGVAGQKAGGV